MTHHGWQVLAKAARVNAISVSMLAAGSGIVSVAGCDGRGDVDGERDGAAAWLPLATADETWNLRWRPIPAEIPALEPFAVEVIVLDAAGRPAGENVSVVVDATMPHHGHGMNVVPRVTRRGDRWLAEGLLLHMPGRWEFTIDVERDGEVERAQWTEELES